MRKSVSIMLTDQKTANRPYACPICHRNLIDAKFVDTHIVGKLVRDRYLCQCGLEIHVCWYAIPRDHAAHAEAQRKVQMWQNMARTAAQFEADLERMWAAEDERNRREESGLKRLLASVKGAPVHV